MLVSFNFSPEKNKMGMIIPIEYSRLIKMIYLKIFYKPNFMYIGVKQHTQPKVTVGPK